MFSDKLHQQLCPSPEGVFHLAGGRGLTIPMHLELTLSFAGATPTASLAQANTKLS